MTQSDRPHGGKVRRQRVRILARDGDRCHWCAQQLTDELPATLEHLTPLWQGGSHDDDNAVLACAPCNSTRPQHVRCDDCGTVIRRWATARWEDKRRAFHGHCGQRAA